LSYSIKHIASIINSKSAVEEELLIQHLLIDSRRLVFPGSTLFFALKGPRRDGHSFIAELYEKGVRAFVVSEMQKKEDYPGAAFLQVADTLQALQLLVASHRKQFDLPVIGITGSNGKTIVKEWLHQLLEREYNIVRSPKSYNSQIGVPLSVWLLNEKHNLAIFEAGISQAGEMDKLQRIIQPTIGIFTNIGEAHGENFLNVRQKVNEKLRLFTHVQTLIYCKDYPEIHEAVAALWQHLNKTSSQPFTIINWSTVSEASLQVLTIFKEEGQTLITASWNEKVIQIKIPFTDDASVENAIHCWCTLLHLGISPREIETKMAGLGAVAMRLELKNGINHCSVINDSYSADLNSFRIALDFLAQQPQHKKRTVILSDILQSGKSEKELYQEVAHSLIQHRVNRLIGIGERIYQQQALIKQAGDMEVIFYPSVDAFRKDFSHLVFKDETILIKGARVYEFEQIDRLLEQKVHQTILEVNLTALVHNLKQYQQQLSPGTKLMVMVKAFAYGSGSYEIASVLQYHKADYLAVAYADEAVELRKAGIHLPIMIMNPDESAFDVMVQHNLEPELFSISLLKAFGNYLKAQGILQYPVHIELDTGMNRLGFPESDIPHLIDILKGDSFKVQSLFSHLVASEDPQHDAFTRKQAELFLSMSRQVEQSLSYPVLKHIANTSGISRHPDLQMDMVRLGIGLYGIDAGKKNLLEVSTLRSTVAQVRKLKEGETVSYGRRGVLLRDSIIATIRIGYADGYPRSLSNGAGKIWIKGRLAPIVGSICMDMTMIDVTDIPGVQEGDDVIVFGKELPVNEVAQWANTIPYEILTGVSQRVKRVYYEE
jgi:alanine racemase